MQVIRGASDDSLAGLIVFLSTAASGASPDVLAGTPLVVSRIFAFRKRHAQRSLSKLVRAVFESKTHCVAVPGNFRVFLGPDTCYL